MGINEQIHQLLADQGEAFTQFKDTFSQRLERLELRVDTPGNPAASKGGIPRTDHVKAFERFLRDPRGAQARAELEEVQAKAASLGTLASGGYAAPEELAREVAKRMRDLSPIRRLARVVTVSSADFRMLVNINDAASGWVGEDATSGNRSATENAQLGEVRPTFGTVYAYPKATEELVADAAFDIATWFIESSAEELAIAENAAFVSGNGTNKPTGFLTGSPSSASDTDSPARSFGTLQYVPTGVAGAFPFDQQGSPPGNPGDVLYDTIYALRAPYRQNAVWLMNSATAGTVRKWKDADGRYLWTDRLDMGQPPLLCGYPVVTDESMPDIGSNTFPMAFGDWRRGYLIADSFGLRVTLDDNITTPGQVKLYVRKRVGGKILDDNAIKLIKCAAS
ncbi:phage major capsid protein [Pseudomarimonas arenosa]|uniref:Phage major capsid protein n=1 Tax=Pseudomarimonas arenosa TaxID=2774145 RepID=A0AAW3ZS82_9GAMM|nr:phage major capsid protein [Pseudomarimonas arenosa]MBD8527919.1 phage major capsid protein [Pseudomarimonas arenosa]